LGNQCKLKIKVNEAATKSPKEYWRSLKRLLGNEKFADIEKGVVECPVKNEFTPFIVCFYCPNFIRRFKKEVYCKARTRERQ